jgi:hypothetical protein
MQIGSLMTSRCSVRAEVEGWGFEDSSLLVRGRHIGMTPSPKRIPYYKTVLEALADGWVLLGVPVREVYPREEGVRDTEVELWNWWITRSTHKEGDGR